jgi:sporulation protein YlmC with PRC-barrel domain
MRETEMRSLSQQELAKDKVHSLISSELICGTDVYNRNGEHLGTVQNVMIDKYSGQVAYAVMSFGGFLGIGEKYHPLPWHVLKYDTGKGGYVVDLEKERLRSAPSYALTDPLRWEDDEWRTRLDDYYKHNRPPPLA